MALIIGVAMVASSLVLSSGMKKLGDGIERSFTSLSRSVENLKAVVATNLKVNVSDQNTKRIALVNEPNRSPSYLNIRTKAE